jgi:hypothetical protein
MITIIHNYFAFLLAVALSSVLTTSLSAQDLRPKKIGLPGRTVWALATSASAGSGTASVITFAATDKGLWRSGDDGESWTETSLRDCLKSHFLANRRTKSRIIASSTNVS